MTVQPAARGPLLFFFLIVALIVFWFGWSLWTGHQRDKVSAEQEAAQEQRRDNLQSAMFQKRCERLEGVVFLNDPRKMRLFLKPNSILDVE